jgi:hypothetical protein
MASFASFSAFPEGHGLDIFTQKTNFLISVYILDVVNDFIALTEKQYLKACDNVCSLTYKALASLIRIDFSSVSGDC